MTESPKIWAIVESKLDDSGRCFVSHMVVAEWPSFDAAERDRHVWMNANPMLHYTIQSPK